MICNKCGENKSESLFRQSGGRRTGKICKKCCNKRCRLWRVTGDTETKKRKERDKTQKLRHKYPERMKGYEKKYAKTIGRIFSIYKKNAKTRKRTFELSKENFQHYWQSNCYYCGDKLQTVGFDRINNNVGYTINNVVPCCPVCNRMRMAMGQKDFINKCIKIANKRQPDPNQEEFL